MASYLYSGLSYLGSAVSYLGSAVYTAAFGATPENEPELDVSSPTPAVRQLRPSGEPINPLYSSAVPLPMSNTTSAPLYDDYDAQLELALRLSAQHPQLPVAPSLATPPAAWTNPLASQQQQLDFADDAALAEAIRLSKQDQRVQPSSTAPLSFSSQVSLAEAQELEKILALSLEESKAAAATHRMAQAQFSSAASTSSTGKSLAEQEEAAALALATMRSLSKGEDQYVPMLGERVLVTDIIADNRRAVKEEERKLSHALGEGNERAIKSSLERIEKNTSTADQLESMAKVYSHFYPIRGDGNCFYTSFAYDMLLGFAQLTAPQKGVLIKKFEQCQAPQAAKEAAVDALTILQAGGSILGADDLMLYFVECLRAIGVQYVQDHREEYAAFLVKPMTYDKLLMGLGEMGEDAEEPMIIALVKAVDHPIRVVRVTPKVSNVFGTAGSFNYDGPTRRIPAEKEPERVLLFTDGHYQLLSKK